MSAPSAPAQLGLKTACVEKRATAGRHLPQHRLHPVQGAAAGLGEIRRGAPRVSPRIGVKARRVELDLPAMMAHKDKVVDEQHQGHRVPVQEEQDRLASRAAASITGRRQGRGRTARDHARSQEHRHRHRLGRHAACRASTVDEKQHRLLDRRAGARRRCRSAGGDRRRLYRPGAGLGLAAGWAPR